MDNLNQKYNIIMFNMAFYWDWQKKGIVNRNYHVLNNLLKDERINKIIAVDYFPQNFKQALRVLIKDQFLNDFKGSVVFGDLSSRCWRLGSKLYVYSSIDYLLRKNRIIKELNRIQDIINREDMDAQPQILNQVQDDASGRFPWIVWSYNPLYVDYFDKFSQKLNIFDAVDNWAAHSSYQKKQKMLENNYKIISQKSDIVFTVSEELKKNLFEENDNCNWVANGVDLDHFKRSDNKFELVENIQQPRIGFLGIMQDRVDSKLIKFLAKKNPKKSFIMAGPVWPNFPKKELEQFKNIFFLGPISYNDIPKIYSKFDVAIIPYKTNQFVKSTNSMKFYEYLSMGLPVVTSNIPGAKVFEDVLYIAHSHEEFDKMVNRALNEDNQDLKIRRRDAVLGHTWKDRIDLMLKIIK